MKLSTKYLTLFFAGLGLAACAPSAKQMKDLVEKNPDIVFVAIEKDPEKFIEVVNKAARAAQERAGAKQAEDEQKKQDEEFKNPLKPEITDKHPIRGDKNAPITIVEYSDFECPYCSRGFQTMEEVMKEFKGKVRLVYKHLPLDFHPKAYPTARYFVAISWQSPEKAYEFHDLIFKNQAALREKGEAFMKESAKKVGADMKRLEKDLANPDVAKFIDADTEEAKKFGFSGTPGFLINGVSLKGAYPFPEFKKIIERHLSAKK